MSVELSIMRLFCDKREFHTTHSQYIGTVQNLEREIKNLFGLITDYYEEYDTDHITKDELARYFDSKYPLAKDRDMYYHVIEAVFYLNVQPELMKKLLDQLIEKHYATAIVNKLIPTMEGAKYDTLAQAKADIEEYISLLHNPPQALQVPEPCDLDVSELIEREIMDEGIPWRLTPLTKTIGGIRANTLGLIYAYVDSGKTSFAMDSMAAQAGKLSGNEIIAYAGNEEKAPRLKLRAIQALIKMTRSQIVAAGYEAVQEAALEAGLERIKIFDDIVTGEQIQFILNEYHPAIMYVDQATDVEVTFKRRTEGVTYLQSLFKWYRHLANMSDCAIIAVSQGVGDAGDKKWLKLSDVYGSRVAIQGALDYAIGIGRKDVTKNPADEEFRYIHIPKNKLHDGGSIKFKVHFDRQRCIWRVI